jgi:hypothetical protein
MNIESCIYEGKIYLEFKPTLAFLFFEGENVDLLLGLYKKLKSINQNMEIIGINGNKGNVNSNIPYITKNHQISCLFFDIDKNDFFIECFSPDIQFKDKFLDINIFKNSATILFPPFRYNINDFLDEIDVDMYNIYGGIYGIKNNIGAFYNGNFYNDKIISVVFNQDVIEFFSIAIHGFKPIGVKFKITKAKDNILYEIDNEKALDVIEEYIGEIKQENIDKFLHPFCVYHKGYESLASIKSIDREKKSISFYKYIYEEEYIRITIPSNQKSIMKQLDSRLKDIECDGAFMFSCVGRYAYYKDLLEFEIAKVSDIIKKPFAGFLTYGEIGSNDINSKSILQNQTMDLVFFKVKK